MAALKVKMAEFAGVFFLILFISAETLEVTFQM